MRLVVAVLAALLAAAPASAATHRVGGITVEVAADGAFQGGMIDVRMTSRRPIRGIVYAVLDGRRCPAFWSGGGLRALVPVPVTHRPGRDRLGIEIRTARGRQRFAIPLSIAPRAYPARAAAVPDDKRARITSSDSIRDGRRLQLVLRTVTPRQEWTGPFAPPVVGVAAEGFGGLPADRAAPPVESLSDAIHGEYHRGLDYEVPAGTPVTAPAAGVVVFADELGLTGRTVVIDHGHGLLSVIAHLDSAAVTEGDRVEPGRTLGAAGMTGVAARPHVHWGVYLHGVAIDPRVTGKL